jgi:hypothetical protein
MSVLKAKPIVDQQYWVVVEDDVKVGNVTFDGTKYDVTLNDNKITYLDKDLIESEVHIIFENKKTQTIPPLYHIYPTDVKPVNSVFEVNRKIHLYTKTEKSRCYYAAGYYLNENSKVTFCPKYIFVERYNYDGPYKTKEEAINALHRKIN